MTKITREQVEATVHNLEEAELEGINLSGANLSRADLYKANLTGADLSESIYTSLTILPKYFDPEAVGMVLVE